MGVETGSAREDAGAVAARAAEGKRKPDRVAQCIVAQGEESAAAEIEIEQPIGTLRETGPRVASYPGKIDHRRSQVRIDVAQSEQGCVRERYVPLDVYGVARGQVEVTGRQSYGVADDVSLDGHIEAQRGG